MTLWQQIRTALTTRSYWVGPKSLKDPALTKYFGFTPSFAGVEVTPENMFTFSAVFDAVNIISSDIAKLPLNLRKRLKDGGSEHYYDARLYHVLKSEPNNEMTSMVLRRTMIAHALTLKGGFAEIERDQFDRPAALWLITPDRIEPSRRQVFNKARGRMEDGPLEYVVDGDTNNPIPARDIVHLQGLGYDGYAGYEMVNLARQTIGMALAMEKFGAQYFGKGTMFGGWLETEEEMDDDQRNGLRAEIERFRSLSDSAFRILIPGGGRKLHQFAGKPADSQMNESRTNQVLETARFFRLPPHKLGVNTPGTVSYASVEAANLDYYTGCLLDWITNIEQELNRKLISPLERRQQFIKHNVLAFLRGDTASRATFYGTMLDRGVFCADDVLELEDMNPQPGGQGRLYLVQGAQIPKNQLVALTDAKIESEKIKANPPAPPAAADDQVQRDLRERLAAADTLTVDLRREADQQRDARVAAEATGLATTEELTRLRESEAATRLQSERAHALAESLRADLSAERDRATEYQQQLTDLAGALATAQASVTAAEAAAELLRGAVTARETAATAAAVALAAAQEQVRTLEGSHAGAAEERAAASARADAAERSLSTATDAHAAAAAALAVSEDRLVAARADVDRVTVTVDAVRAELASAQATSAAAEARAVSGATDRTALETQLAAATATAEQLRGALEAAQTERAAMAAAQLRVVDQARVRRLTTIAAHRGLMLDAMGRMVRRECQQARARSGTVPKFRAWLEDFATVHEPLCIDALVPAMRTHLAWRESTDDAAAVTAALIRTHLAEFRRRLDLVLGGEDFHADLERMLTRWDAEEPAAIADQILMEEVRHVS